MGLMVLRMKSRANLTNLDIMWFVVSKIWGVFHRFMHTLSQNNRLVHMTGIFIRFFKRNDSVALKTIFSLEN